MLTSRGDLPRPRTEMPKSYGPPPHPQHYHYPPYHPPSSPSGGRSFTKLLLLVGAICIYSSILFVVGQRLHSVSVSKELGRLSGIAVDSLSLHTFSREELNERLENLTAALRMELQGAIFNTTAAENMRLAQLGKQIDDVSQTLERESKDGKRERVASRDLIAALEVRLNDTTAKLKLLSSRLPPPPPPPVTAAPYRPPTPAPISPYCLMRFPEIQKLRPEEWFGAVLDPTRDLKAIDVSTGTVSIIMGFKATASACLMFNTQALDIDPYIEAHRLRASPSNVPCDVDLRNTLNSIFGPPTPPHSDVWHYVYNTKFSSLFGGGVILQLAIRPRKGFATDKPFSFNFTLPSSCIKGTPANVTLKLPTIPLHLPVDDVPRVKLAGDLLEGLHDGVLADGGRVGTLAISHGFRWKWGFTGFKEGIRAFLSSAFGSVDEGYDDAVLKGWDDSTISFILGPRHVSRNMNGLKVFLMDAIPTNLIQAPVDNPSAMLTQPLKVSEAVQIEDVITPYAELKGDPIPVMTEQEFLKGFKINVTLHAGVFVDTKTNAEFAIRTAVTTAFGPPLSGRDVVRVVDPLHIEIEVQPREALPLRSSMYNQSYDNPPSHRILPLGLPAAIFAATRANCSCACYYPAKEGCEYDRWSGADIVPFPSIVVKTAEPLQFKWAVIGAGPSGMNGLGRLLDLWPGREDHILWVDERGFKVGRLEGYHDVQSMNPCSDFLAYMNDYEAYKAFPLGASKKPLQAYEGNKKHCRLGFLSEPLLKATHLIRSRLVSFHGRVRDMHKVWFPNATKGENSTDFIWSLRVGDLPPVWVTDGIIVAIGADHHSVQLREGSPTEVPFTTALNPGSLRSFIIKNKRKERVNVLVFGAGPSGVVALHNLALVPEVANVIHMPKHNMKNDYTTLEVARPDGSFMNVTRITYTTKAVEEVLPTIDFQVQCIGWRFPSFPYNGSIMVAANNGNSIYVSPKLFNVGVKHAPKYTKAQLFFISSLRAMSRSAMRCSKPDAINCLERQWGPLPPGLTDPNANVIGNYTAE